MRDVQEITTQYNIDKHYLQPQQIATHHAVDCLQYFFSTALGVIQQGEQITQHLIDVLKQEYITPYASLHSLQESVASALEAYGTYRIPPPIEVEDLEDYQVHVSWQHLQYAIIHVLQFLQMHQLNKQICLWITNQQGLHLRLVGKALSPQLLHKLFTLFPTQETTHHLGLAISKLLIEAHGGQLSYEAYTLPQESYTEFVINLPAANACRLIKEVHT